MENPIHWMGWNKLCKTRLKIDQTTEFLYMLELDSQILSKMSKCLVVSFF